MRWLTRHRDALLRDHPNPAGPPARLPSITDPQVMPRLPAFRQGVANARGRLEELCGSGELVSSTAKNLLATYSVFLKELETRSLRDMLAGVQPQWTAFGKLPGWMRDAAHAVLDEDHRSLQAGDRSGTMARLGQLHLPVRELLVQAVMASGISALGRLRSCLNAVHDWPLHGTRTPGDYQSPVWIHQQFLDACEGVGEAALKNLRVLVRHCDEHWHPDEPSLLLNALLVPEGLDVDIRRMLADDDPAARRGLMLLREHFTAAETQNLQPALKHLIHLGGVHDAPAALGDDDGPSTSLAWE